MGRRRRGEDARGQQPGDRRADRHRAEHGRGRDPARDRGGQRRVARLAREDRQGARAILRHWFDLMMANQDDLAHAHDRRAGQAAGRVARRDRLRRVLHRVVRRGSASASTATPFPAHQADKRIVVHQGADRRVRRDHAVELPGRDDHAQGRPGAGRRLHDGGRSPRAQTPFSALALAELAERAGVPEGRLQRRHRRRPPPSAAS